MFCLKCGSQVQEGVAYCPQCGAAMVGVANNTVNNAGNNTGSNIGYQPNLSYGSSPIKSKGNDMNKLRIGASILVIIATFMPYISAMGYSVGLFGEGRDGIYFIILAAAVIICDVLRKNVPAIVLSIITFGFAAYEVIDTRKVASDAYGLLEYESGFYCLILGAIAMAVAGPVMKAIEKKR